MPRSRTEAMLSGCCVLTTPYQGASEFINFDTKKIWQNVEGEKEYISVIDKMVDAPDINGFIVPDNPSAIAALCDYLISKKYNRTVEIGQVGKKLAQKIFSKERYDADWHKLLEEVIK